VYKQYFDPQWTITSEGNPSDKAGTRTWSFSVTISATLPSPSQQRKLAFSWGSAPAVNLPFTLVAAASKDQISAPTIKWTLEPPASPWNLGQDRWTEFTVTTGGGLTAIILRHSTYQDTRAGRIDQSGPGVNAEWIGRDVWCFGAQSYRAFGTAAEFTVVPIDHVAPLPSGVSMEQGACLGIPGITAHRGVHVGGDVRGRTVLIQGAAGSVGLCAVALARHAGARVIGTVRSGSELARSALDTKNSSTAEISKTLYQFAFVAFTVARGRRIFRRRFRVRSFGIYMPLGRSECGRSTSREMLVPAQLPM
jgi:hypothetical protein